MNTGPWFNIKKSSYQYRKSHCGDKTVVRSSYLHNGISYTGKMSSLYWIGAQVCIAILKSRIWNDSPIKPEALESAIIHDSCILPAFLTIPCLGTQAITWLRNSVHIYMSRGTYSDLSSGMSGKCILWALICWISVHAGCFYPFATIFITRVYWE